MPALSIQRSMIVLYLYRVPYTAFYITISFDRFIGIPFEKLIWFLT